MPEETILNELDDMFGTSDVLDLVHQRFEVGDENIIDARGLRCPQPARRLREVLSARAIGDRFALVADDPLARIDIPRAASQSGAAVVAQCVTGTVAVFLIEPTP